MSSSILFPTNEYATSSKSPQQIQKLMMPNFQSLGQYLNHILTKGHPLQHHYAYKNFHRRAHQTLPQVCLHAPNAQNDNQIIIIQSLEILLQENSNDLTSDDVEMVFHMVLDCLNNWTSTSNEKLIDIAEKIIEIHPHPNHLVKRLQKTALELGRANQPIISRVIAGKLISILPRYMGGMIKGQMVDILKRIHSDAEIQAKKAWVRQIFPKMLCNSELEFIQLHLQQKIYQSVYDENQEVGLLALETILKFPTQFSIEEQSSRIIKLFLDSMTSKNQKISLMTTSMMGQIYQKLQNIILRNQYNCIRFWKSLIQLAQSKDERILNNLIYNLPGILILATQNYNVEPICEVYIELFYDPNANKQLLSTYFHQMAAMFPGKKNQLKEVAYLMFNQILQHNDQSIDNCFKILDNILCNLYQSRQVFMATVLASGTPNQQGNLMYMSQGVQSKQKTLPSIETPIMTPALAQPSPHFQHKLCEYLCQYLTFLLNKKNATSTKTFYDSILACSSYFPADFNEQNLLPKIYFAIRNKTAHLQTVVKILVKLVSRDVSNNILINNYASKVNVQLSKSTKSYQREAAMMFFYHASFCFSIQTFQEFKLGEKFLNLHNDRNFRNKVFFIQSLPRLIYFLTREEKIENNIIIARFGKDSDPQIIKILERTDMRDNEAIRQEILIASKALKEKEREKVALHGRRISSNLRKDSKQFKKQDILKKRIQTKSKAKIVIKDVPKRKTPNARIEPIIRKNS